MNEIRMDGLIDICGGIGHKIEPNIRKKLMRKEKRKEFEV